MKREKEENTKTKKETTQQVKKEKKTTKALYWKSYKIYQTHTPIKSTFCVCVSSGAAIFELPN